MLDLVGERTRKLLKLEEDEYEDESKTDDWEVKPEDPPPWCGISKSYWR